MPTRTLFKIQVRCPTCGKKAKKHTESYFSRDAYQGNLRVIQDRSRMGSDYHDLILWDGESYEMQAGYFCKNRCAIEYANQVERSRRGH